jgi:hypothetical protein
MPYSGNQWYVPDGPSAFTYGGGGQPPAAWRDLLDARRSGMDPRLPQAEYPDGYLGNVPSRRSDRVLNAIQKRYNSLTERTSKHTVVLHPSEYEWPPEFGLTTGLKYQAEGRKWAPKGEPDRVATYGRNSMPSPREIARQRKEAAYSVSQYTADRLRPLQPTWKIG